MDCGRCGAGELGDAWGVFILEGEWFRVVEVEGGRLVNDSWLVVVC